MRKFLAGLGILSLVLALAAPALAATTDTVTATVTPQLVAVSVDVPDVDYGVLDINETSAPSVVITATNDGNVTEKFGIKGSNSTNWTLSDTDVGADTFMHEFAVDDDSYTTYTALNNTTYDTLDASVSTPSGTQLFKLRLKMPSSTSTTLQQSTIVTVLATEV